MGPAVLRLLPSIVLSAVILALAASTAAANSGGTSAGSFRGLSAASSTRATTPSSSTQSKIAPAKPHATPPAGVRPHTDLAAATKIIGLSSGNLIKHSSLFPKMPLPPGAPSLAGPVMNKIGATEGGSASFKAVAGIPTSLSNGRVYPTSGGGAGGGRARESLSGSQVHGVADHGSDDSDRPRRSSGGGLLYWLQALFTAAGIGAIGWWMWNAAPKGARMALPATT
jgi:hypothetical protein